MTPRGWLLLLLLLAGVGAAFLGAIHPYLAPLNRLPSRLLVVEGWIPDYALADSLLEFRNHEYDVLITTGGPLQEGFHLVEFGTYAELAAAELRQLGMDPKRLIPVSADDAIKDRTYQSALALRSWFREQGSPVDSLTVYTVGAHARRSRLLFQIVLGDQIQIGVVPTVNRSYDAARWWMSSEGVRTVMSEFIAYLYARFLFLPD